MQFRSAVALLPVLISIFSLPIPQLAHGNDFEWTVKKSSWSAADERNYSKFVVSIGQAVEKRSCGNVNRCMHSPANPYRNTDPARLSFFADCADFPYFLRAYFAWKNDLPFGIASAMRAQKHKDNQDKDIRYTPFGNVVSSRMSFVPTWNDPVIITSVLNTLIPNYISTASFRTSAVGNDTGRLFSDFYPVKIDRSAITPGTNLYDANGHVGVIYKITEDGHAWYVDAHPDNSLTVGKFSTKFSRSNPFVGAGFKKFRPLELENADESWGGIFEGGDLVGVPNSRLRDYSYEQYFGTKGQPSHDWKKAQFIFKGKVVSFHDYVRLKLAGSNFRLDPVVEIKSTVAEICMNLKDRVTSVQLAIDRGINKLPYPVTMPENIYGSSGDWENYSSPGRDVSIKVLFKQIILTTEDHVRRWRERDPELVTDSVDLPRDLLNAYDAESANCQIQYKNSVGQAVSLNLEQVRARIFKLSFSPYDCVERRWGAEGAELSACSEDLEKREWYQGLQQLRNHTERDTEAKMNYTRSEYQKIIPGVGLELPTEVDVREHLQRL